MDFPAKNSANFVEFVHLLLFPNRGNRSDDSAITNNPQFTD
jgi:hypothetical protein